MRARAVLVLPAVVALLLGAGCGGSRPGPFRIGVLSDCYGFESSVHEVIVASAELPLLERGGTLRGKNPSDGVAGARVGGRPVELLEGCVAGNDEVIPQARRLVEEDGANVLLGTLDPQQGLILRAYARRRPATTFLIQPSDAPELTLDDPAANVFRFFQDAAEQTAGLGAYAYSTLGWRTAVTVGDDTPYGWENVSGFVAEFCALGGHVVERRWLTLASDPAAVAPTIRPADGVYLGTAISPMLGFVKRYAAAHPDVARRLVSSAILLYTPQVLALAKGVVVAGGIPLEPTRAEAAYVASFTKAFPQFPATDALDPLAVPYRDGVEAVLEALSRGGKLQRALAAVRLESPTGTLHLDARRQAIGPNYLSQVVAGPNGKPATRTLRVVPDVEQTFGGYFRPGGPPANRTQPACVRHAPPAWARR
jgi:branched-chain amino acid transport system substrate-binding protein